MSLPKARLARERVPQSTGKGDHHGAAYPPVPRRRNHPRLIAVALALCSITGAGIAAQNDVTVRTYGSPSGVPMGTPIAPGTVDRMLFSAVATQSQVLEISLSAPGVAGKTALLALGVQQLNAPVPPATLLVDPLATFIGAFDPNGEIRFALPLPNLPGLTLYFQGIAIDFANPQGLFAFSRGLDVQIVPRQTRTTDYDNSIARNLMNLAWHSYEFPTEGGPLYEGRVLTGGFQVVKEIASVNSHNWFGTLGWPETYVFVAKNAAGEVAVVFRGTDPTSLRDWTTDLQFAHVNGYHGGFLLAYQTVMAELTNVVTRHVNPHARVFITGHSLGGGIAPIAALHLEPTLTNLGVARNNIVLYAFAGPRAMNPQRAAQLGTAVPNHFNVVNKEDLIGHLPPPNSLGFLYEHMPRMRALYPRRAMIAETGVGYVVAGPRLLPSLLIPGIYLAHNPREYSERLTGVLPAPRVWLTVSPTGYMTLNWSFPERAPWNYEADYIALFQGAPDPRNPGNSLFGQFRLASASGSFVTGTPKGPGFHVAYVQQYNLDLEKKILASAGPYTWPTPQVSMTRASNGFVQLNWVTNDPGTWDYVALYNRDPRLAGPNGYLLFQSHFAVPARSWISARLWGPGLWIAYIEDYGSAASRRIVAIAGPTQ